MGVWRYKPPLPRFPQVSWGCTNAAAGFLGSGATLRVYFLFSVADRRASNSLRFFNKL